MADAVIDTTVLAFANGPCGPVLAGALARCLPYVSKVTAGAWRCRYNKKLLAEYISKVRKPRNDLVAAFLTILDTRQAFLAKNSLSHSEYVRAKRIRWPTHDHHLLAAAVGGIEPSIVVTEYKLAQLHTQAKREFGVSVLQV